MARDQDTEYTSETSLLKTQNKNRLPSKTLLAKAALHPDAKSLERVLKAILPGYLQSHKKWQLQRVEGTKLSYKGRVSLVERFHLTEKNLSDDCVITGTTFRTD